MDDINQQSDNEGTQPDLEKIKKKFSEEEIKSRARQSLTEILDSSSDNDENEVAEVKIDKKQLISRKKKITATETKISDGLKLNSSRIKINHDSSDSDMDAEINYDNGIYSFISFEYLFIVSSMKMIKINFMIFFFFLNFFFL